MKGQVMDILLLGSGGREHAIAVSLKKSSSCGTLYVAPGNGGTASIAKNVSLDINDATAVTKFAQEHNIGLVVIGPEAPLVAGVADAVREEGIPCFGPGAHGAQLEGSKRFSKEFMVRHGIPTADYEAFTEAEPARAYVSERFAAGVGVLVVKADGLAAGKGVVVAKDEPEALAAVDACFEGHFGAAGSTVVIEEGLTGPECSYLVFTDGTTMRPMATAQDHKRAYDGDRGPNTGGMGCYSPVPIVTDDEMAQMTAIMEKAVAGMAADGIDYRGVLYGGFMLTPQGPKVLEFNARFGDPETQVILPRLKTDLVDVMMACAECRLADVELSWRPEWAVTVVLASKGYPLSYKKGFAITDIDKANALPGVTVYHAGTALDAEGVLRTAGGRVLDVTAIGETFSEARDRAYEAADAISFDGKMMRLDVGLRALSGRAAWEA